MKSPFANCEAHLVQEARTVTFRGEEYSYLYSCYECEVTKERFTTTPLEEQNVQQVYDQYRAKYGIPNAEAIAALKEKYGVSAARLGLILGFGENQIGNYIDGEVPNRANGKTLAAVQDPVVFDRYLDLAKGQLKETVFLKLKDRVHELMFPVYAAEDECAYGKR